VGDEYIGVPGSTGLDHLMLPFVACKA